MSCFPRCLLKTRVTTLTPCGVQMPIHRWAMMGQEQGIHSRNPWEICDSLPATVGVTCTVRSDLTLPFQKVTGGGTIHLTLCPLEDILFKDCVAINPGIMRPKWYGNCVATYGHLVAFLGPKFQWRSTMNYLIVIVTTALKRWWYDDMQAFDRIKAWLQHYRVHPINLHRTIIWSMVEIIVKSIRKFLNMTQSFPYKWWLLACHPSNCSNCSHQSFQFFSMCMYLWGRKINPSRKVNPSFTSRQPKV